MKNRTEQILLRGTITLLAGTVPARAQLVESTVKGILVAEVIKATVKLGFDGIQSALPKVRGWLTPPPKPTVNAVVEQTYYRKDRTVRYPHQPLVRELFTMRAIRNGTVLNLRVWTNGALGLDLVNTVPYSANSTKPDWARPIEMNHLAKACGSVLNGEHLPEDSDETYELVVRCQGINWPRTGLATRGFATVVVPHERLSNRCLDPDFFVGVGTIGRPNQQRNGTAVELVFDAVPILPDVYGNGSSLTLRPTGIPDLVEPNGRPPAITRLAATPPPPTSAYSTDERRVVRSGITGSSSPSLAPAPSFGRRPRRC